MKKQLQMSSLDISIIVNELQEIVSYRIDNIYSNLEESFLLFKLSGVGSLRSPQVILEPGKRIHLTYYKYSFPPRPSSKIMNLRSHLKGCKISSVSQVGYDRLVKFELVGKQKFSLYLELFGRRSNLIVVTEDQRIIYAHWYRRMKDRDILPGKTFQLPPSQSISLLEVSDEELIHRLKELHQENIPIIKVISSNFTGGGILFEEVLARANIPKDELISTLTEEQLSDIVTARNSILEDSKNPKPVMIVDSSGSPIGYLPFPFISFTGNEKKFTNYSELLDFYYMNVEEKHSDSLMKREREREKILRMLEDQKKSLLKFQERKKKYKELGDLIYVHFTEIDELLDTIRKARRNNVSWEVIIEKLTEAKKKGMKAALIMDKIYPEKGKIRINLEGVLLTVDFRKTVTQLADAQYKVAKKASRKIEPVIEAIKNTEELLANIDRDIANQTEEEKVTLIKRKRKWYEKYHWTITTNGYLIIAGKDIRTNEEITKRRMDKQDYFFHADVHGAPYTILITNSSDKPLTEIDFQQASLIAAVFSSAWKDKYGSADVYYVPAENVGFTAPSGEYIPKGGIMVRGNRTYIKGVLLELAVGIIVAENHSQVIYGSEDVIKERTSVYVVVKPGEISKGKLAKQIHKFFLNSFTGQDKAKVKALDLNEIVQALPGDGQIARVIRPSS